MVVNSKKIECGEKSCEKLIDTFIKNLLDRTEYYRTVLPDKWWIEYKTTLRFGSRMRVDRCSITDEVDGNIKETLRLLMYEELFSVLNQTRRELGLIKGEDKKGDLPQYSYETKLTIDD